MTGPPRPPRRSRACRARPTSRASCSARTPGNRLARRGPGRSAPNNVAWRSPRHPVDPRARAPRARLPGLPRVRARAVAQHAGGLPQRSAAVRRLPAVDATSTSWRPSTPTWRASSTRSPPGPRRGPPRGRRRCSARPRACAPSTATCAARAPGARPDRRPARAAQVAEAAQGAVARRRRPPAARAEGDRPGRAARPRAAGADVRLRAARVGGHRPGGRRRRPQGRRAARAGQGLQGAPGPGRPRGGHRRAPLPGARPADAHRDLRRPPPVRQPPRRPG